MNYDHVLGITAVSHIPTELRPVIVTTDMPDVGIQKARQRGVRQWWVMVSIHGLTPEDARKLAGELLNAADDVEKRNKEDQGD